MAATSPEMVWSELQDAGCSDEEIDKITWENTCRFFDFDPFTHIDKEHASVRALRSTATDVDVSETSRHEYQRRWQERKAS